MEEKYTIANGYKFDATVIYGDTDSVMIKFGNPDLAEVSGRAKPMRSTTGGIPHAARGARPSDLPGVRLQSMARGTKLTTWHSAGTGNHANWERPALTTMLSGNGRPWQPTE